MATLDSTNLVDPPGAEEAISITLWKVRLAYFKCLIKSLDEGNSETVGVLLPYFDKFQ